MKVFAPHDVTVSTTSGCIFLKGGEEHDIAPYLAKASFEVGCRPVDVDAKEAQVKAAVAPINEEAIRSAIKQIMEDGNQSNFNKRTQKPKQTAVADISGVEHVDVATIDRIYDELLSGNG